MAGILSRRVEVSPRRWLFLPIGVKIRELDGSALLAFEAARRGWGVIIGHKNVLKDRTDLPRGIQIEKKIAKGTAAKIPRIQATGRRVCAWCEEGLVYPNAEEYGRRKVEREAYDQLDMFFAWGGNQAEDMASLGCSRDKLIATGNPRFDLHRPDFRGLFAGRAEHLRRMYAPFILVNTRFSLRNGLRASDDIVTKMRNQGKVKTTCQEAELQALVEFHGAGFAKFIELTELLSRRFPDHTIVVRPHPAERVEPWQAQAATLPNVRVVQEGNVVEWLLASEICIHTNCTTGVESYLLGKTSISYRPVCDPRFDLYLPNALSLNAFDEDEVLELVAAALRGEGGSRDQHASERAQVASRYIANVSDSSACERILDALDVLDLPEQRLSFRVGPLQGFKIASERTLRTLQGVLPGTDPGDPWRGWSGSAPKVPLRNAVSKIDLLDLLRAAQRVTRRYLDVTVNDIQSNIVCIH